MPWNSPDILTPERFKFFEKIAIIVAIVVVVLLLVMIMFSLF